jgi:RNA polymerase sigma factor (sigma-70 family)
MVGNRLVIALTIEQATIRAVTSQADERTIVERHGGFPSTHWTQILQAGKDGGDESLRALEAFCTRYRQPVLRHIRWRGYSAADADDLTQQFFARLLEKETLASVAPEGGRFRSFLLATLGHFLLNERRRSRAGKRGGGQPIEELDPERIESQRADTVAAFDREYAISVLERAVERTKEEYRREKKQPVFEVLQPFLTQAGEAATYQALARTLETSESNVKVMIHRMRKRFAQAAREEVRGTVSSPDDISDELRFLAEAVSGVREKSL